MATKSTILFNEWYMSKPAKDQKVIRKYLLNNLGWSLHIFHNKLSRTPLTMAEMRLINEYSKETIFSLN